MLVNQIVNCTYWVIIKAKKYFLLSLLISMSAIAQDVAQLESNAQLGNRQAQFELASRYANGRGVPRDPAKALHWYQVAAEQGHASAQYALAAWYADRATTHVQKQQALHWLRKAAKNKHIAAQYELGQRYEFGQEVSQDYTAAAKWYRAAAVMHERAALRLGYLYEQGLGVKLDHKLALTWYQKALELGYSAAQKSITRLQQAKQNPPSEQQVPPAASGQTPPVDSQTSSRSPTHKIDDFLYDELEGGNVESSLPSTATPSFDSIKSLQSARIKPLELDSEPWQADQPRVQGKLAANVTRPTPPSSPPRVPDSISAAAPIPDPDPGPPPAPDPDPLPAPMQMEQLPEEYQEQFYSLEQLAEQGDARAQFQLGLRHYYKKRPSDRIKAYAWFGVAGVQGYSDAEHWQQKVAKIFSTTERRWADQLYDEYYRRYVPRQR